MFSKDEQVRIRLVGDPTSKMFDARVIQLREHGQISWLEVEYTSDGKKCVAVIPMGAISFVQRVSR